MQTELIHARDKTHALFGQMATDLNERGYSVQPSALPDTVSGALSYNLELLLPSDFHPAAIGRGQDTTRNRFVRRNKICWLDEGNVLLEPWHQWTSALQTYLNRRLFLGLYSFESHYTLYETGDRYRRHVDAFRGERNRIISLVTYLNDGWLPDQGGELILYPQGEDAIRVTPAFGTVVLFLSEDVPHEVFATGRKRLGIAGWYRLNASINNQIDPPR